MTDTPVEIPDRAAFRAAEVCEIAQIPPYVLRSWEKEFPGLGAAARPGGPRIYRRSDVEQILRIKQLVFAEGLTLAGVRHRIEGEPPDEEQTLIDAAPAAVPAEVRSRVSHAKRELRELLDMLTGEPPGGGGTAGCGRGLGGADNHGPERAGLDGAGDSGREPAGRDGGNGGRRRGTSRRTGDAR